VNYTHLFQEITPGNIRTMTWPSGSPTSSAIDLQPHGGRAAALHLFSGWTDSMIAIEVSLDGTGYGLFRNSGGAVAGVTGIATAAATGVYEAPPEWYIALAHPFVRLAAVSGTGSGIPQATARTVKMLLVKA
jgi:hypothetical protein